MSTMIFPHPTGPGEVLLSETEIAVPWQAREPEPKPCPQECGHRRLEKLRHNGFMPQNLPRLGL
jgi:hypothetical protein